MANLFHLWNHDQATVPARTTLHRRRVLLGLRHALIALLTGLSVLFGLQAVSSSHQMRDVVVAARTLKEGARIRASDVEIRQVPETEPWPGVVRLPADVIGLYAQIDIEAGQLIAGAMARSPPVVPAGFTVVRLQLAADSSRMRPGDTVSLVSSLGCEDSKTGANDTCIITDSALVMGTATQSGEELGGSVPFALKPQDAVKALAAQEMGALMAVAH
ncbi:flagella basal body P-ring formation protein FlgA [Bifidobacterium sp.]|jgi:hypothetical protein|uniref:flagella basal body P-ring formation protein FlgA n=1 Tax=Bifidobacterium sp. TaxID=41200 RepID=UPI0025BA1A1F|nr:flagella basal body P-ring formation protein FlgA [Bifidobacterium sp.]MCH4209039.1 flagella basal body P-ring formation protein FlgA [Bifidobacterium sp.]MCI1225590.1 flagella basal body P-ring formation protein FlgA [Bifidobacterium sp.]